MTTVAKLGRSFADPTEVDHALVGEQLHQFIAELYPICRSITGAGFRETLQHIARRIPLEVQEIPSGTQVFDWIVPREWNIRDAYVKDPQGRKIVDFKNCNLHVLNYSTPVHARLSLAELRPHLFSLPDRPDSIPYRTSYYKENWGFCLSHRQLEQLEDGEYEVLIHSTLADGHLTYGEYVVPGRSREEVLISCHACHPSLCNDNLSGIAVATWLAQHIASAAPHYSYRFLFIPGTIGAITWLARNEAKTAAIRHGIVLTCVGDRGHSTYKRSRRGDALIDRAFAHVLKHSGEPYTIIDFSPYGYDERQYCSPGFNLPVGCLMRSQHGTFPEYHTSDDNLDFVSPAALADSFCKCLRVFYVLEHDRTFVNLNPKCEPQLGRRGLYRALGGDTKTPANEMAMLWVLNQSDGQHSLLDIAERSGLDFFVVSAAADLLLEHGLLEEKPARADRE